MLLQNFNPNSPIQSDSFVWRYMDFTKIWDLLYNNTIYFSRLDTFHDPIEGLPLSIRTKIQTRHIMKYEITNDEFAEFDIELNRVNKYQIEKWQNGTFCSCWYLTEMENEGNNNSSNHHESQAMWNFFNDDKAFVIKINFNKLLLSLTNSILDLNDQELFDAKYGKVQYLNYGEYLKIINSKDSYVMPSLIKHNSFKFENEIRFLLLRDKIIDVTKDKKGIKVKLNQLLNPHDFDIEIFAHPDMIFTDYREYKDKFKQLGFDLKLSTILTKKSVERLIS